MSPTLSLPSTQRRAAAVTVVGVALVAAGTSLHSSASAQTPTARTVILQELNKGSTFAHIANTRGAPKRANLAGDIITFTYPLSDSAGQRAGKLSASCLTTTGNRDFQKSTITCQIIWVRLPQRDIVGIVLAA